MSSGPIVIKADVEGVTGDAILVLLQSRLW